MNFIFAGSNSIKDFGWYIENSAGRTQPVGQKNPNELGLYDMSGNVWEWCWDWYSPYPQYSLTDPAGPPYGVFRVFRGGGWANSWQHLILSRRCYGGPYYKVIDVGFRPVRTRRDASQ